MLPAVHGFCLVFLNLCLASISLASQSTHYQLWPVVADAAGNTLSSPAHGVQNSVGQPSSRYSSASAYSLQAGYLNDYSLPVPAATITPTFAPTKTVTVTSTPIRNFGGNILSPDFVYAAPNPIRGREGKIYFELAMPAEVELKIYTTQNQFVLSQHWDQLPAGRNLWVWHAGNMANGVYLLYVKARSSQGRTNVVTKKLILIK